MKLEGLKINFLGDSITEGCGTSCEAARFTKLIEVEQKLAVMRNYGIGGTRIARQHTPSATARWDLDFCSRIEKMDPDADAVVVFGGTNDFGHGDAEIGTPADRTPDTFWGACHFMMRSLIEKYPGKPIVIMTPLHRRGEDEPNRNGYVLKQYVEIIRTVAEYYSLPVLDLYAMSGIQPNVPVIKEKFCPDALHPNDAGNRILADRISAFLLAL